MSLVYGLTVDPNRAGNLAALFSVAGTMPEDYTLVTSFTEASVNPFQAYPRLLDAIRDAESICKPLVRIPAPDPWPTDIERIKRYMSEPPKTLNEWVRRNLLWQVACGGFVYWISEESLSSSDLTVHLTVSKLLGHTSIGVMPSDLRTMLESTQMALTDVIVGEADTRTLSLVLQSLNKENKSG
jgi:hypothetical protein